MCQCIWERWFLFLSHLIMLVPSCLPGNSSGKRFSCSAKSPSLYKMEIIMLWLKTTVVPVWNVNKCALQAAHVLWHDLHLSFSWDIVFRHWVSFASLGINNSATLNSYYFLLCINAENYVISISLLFFIKIETQCIGT